VNYLDELSGALTKTGIRGRLRRRIVAEMGDHLACDPAAPLGDPTDLARRFADELGTVRARRAGLATFAALAVAGGLCAAAFLASRGGSLGSFPQLRPGSRPLADLSLGLITIGAQLALVAGLLTLLRVLRHRHDMVLARSESVVISRRAATGLAAGAACMAGLGLLAVEYTHALPSWWTTLAALAAATGGAALAAAMPAVVAAVRLRPVAAGNPGDLFDDLGATVPPALRGRPWAFALAVAAAVGVAVALAGVLQADPFDGIARGAADGAACLAGFAVLGRYLGLR
jgi:hypothetical protein